MGLIAEIIDFCMGNNGSALASDTEIEMEDMSGETRYQRIRSESLGTIKKASAESPEIGGGDDAFRGDFDHRRDRRRRHPRGRLLRRGLELR